MLRDNAIYSSLSDAFNAFQERRKQFGLSNPGTIETVARGALLPHHTNPVFEDTRRRRRGVRGNNIPYAAALHDAAPAGSSLE